MRLTARIPRPRSSRLPSWICRKIGRRPSLPAAVVQIANRPCRLLARGGEHVVLTSSGRSLRHPWLAEPLRFRVCVKRGGTDPEALADLRAGFEAASRDQDFRDRTIKSFGQSYSFVAREEGEAILRSLSDPPPGVADTLKALIESAKSGTFYQSSVVSSGAGKRMTSATITRASSSDPPFRNPSR